MPPKRKATSGNANSKKRSADEPSPRSRKSARREGDQDKENATPRESDSSAKKAAEQTRTDKATTNADKHSVTPKKDDHLPYEYVCINRPQYDVEAEYHRKRAQGEIDIVEDVFGTLVEPIFEEEQKQNIFGASPKDHPDRKWVMMWSAWIKFCDLTLRAKYCDPDNFNMYIYNDFKGYGMQEILVGQMDAFDFTLRRMDDGGLDKLWSIISAIGLWVNCEGVEQLINTDDGEGCRVLINLLGCALLTALSALASAGELSPESRYLDLPLVISQYLHLSSSIPQYGIEGPYVSWRREVVKYFKQAQLDPSKGLSNTQVYLDKLENASNYYTLKYDSKNDDAGQEDEEEEESEDVCLHLKHGTSKDPWAWGVTFKRYMKMYFAGPHFQQYDITKMTRAERAKYAFDGKDPLKKISVKDLQNNLLDFE